ncbi:MAG: phosphotransferase [Chloroflexi bacterium]|nr:phosphotransferase [Chloroflexota bacterium]
MDIFDDLAERLDVYARRWKIEFSDRTLETPSSTLAFGTLKDTRTPVVLKLIKPRSDEHNAWRWLEYHAGQGAARLLAHDEGALLLEQAIPGSELVEVVRAGRDDEATRQMAHIIGRLCGETNGARAIPIGFKTVEALGNAFERNSRALLTARIPAELLDRASHLYGKLCATQGPRRLLHGDLHHYNVLRDTRHGWQVIDPKGVVGEMAYETGAMLRNPIEMPQFYPNPRILKNRVGILCQVLGLNEERVLEWCFSQAILSAVWSIEDNGSEAEISATLRLAETGWELLQTR